MDIVFMASSKNNKELKLNSLLGELDGSMEWNERKVNESCETDNAVGFARRVRVGSVPNAV